MIAPFSEGLLERYGGEYGQYTVCSHVAFVGVHWASGSVALAATTTVKVIILMRRIHVL